MTAPSKHLAIGAALFDDLLKTWGNDDLLFDPGVREQVDKIYPGVARVLDWPELRELFAKHDALASRSKTISRRTGVLAVSAAGIGVALLALLPALQAVGWVPAQAEALLSFVSLALLCVGSVIAFWHRIGMQERDAWLGHRFWTERLRQLHFQILINHVELAAAAIGDDAALGELQRLRQRLLVEMTMCTEMRSALRTIRSDLTEQEAWLTRPVSANVASTPAQLDILLGALGLLRLGVQLEYVGRSLGVNVHAPTLRAQVFKGLGEVCMIAAFPVAVIAAVCFFQNMPAAGQAWSGVVGAIGAIGLTSRALDQGLRASADTERFHWYQVSLSSIWKRFEAGDIEQKISALRDLEMVAYQEFRRFLTTHTGAHFAS